MKYLFARRHDGPNGFWTENKCLRVFRLQFADEDGVRVFREWGRGRAIPVTAEEEEAAITACARLLERTTGRFLLLVFGFVAVLSMLPRSMGSLTVPAVLVLVGWVVTAQYRGQKEITFVFRNRASTAIALDPDTALARRAHQLTWPQLLFVFAGAFAGWVMLFAAWFSPHLDASQKGWGLAATAGLLFFATVLTLGAMMAKATSSASGRSRGSGD